MLCPRQLITVSLKNYQVAGPPAKQANKEAHRQTDRQTDRRTERPTERQREQYLAL